MKRTSWIYVGIILAVCCLGARSQAQIVHEDNACTWGISNDTLVIPDDSIIRDAVLTLHGVRTVGSNSQAAVYVQLLNNPRADVEELLDAQTGNLFEGYGTFLRKVTSAELSSTPRDITISLNAVNDAESWVWTVFDAPVTATFGDASTQPMSSSLLALLDYAGTGSAFGFGLDCDGTAVEGISLALTLQSTTQSTPAVAVDFQTGDTGPGGTVNTDPVLASITDKTVRQLQTLSFAVSATDPDGDTLAYSASNLPQGAAFEGQTFTWTPTTAQSGSYDVIFSVDDGNGGSDTAVVGITVDAATSPSQWTTLAFDDFESGWGSYTDGGSDCLLYTRTKYAPQGNNAANIQSSSSTSYFELTNGIDVRSPGFSEIRISFSFMAVSMDSSNDGFRLDYWDGTQWVTLNTWHTYTDFSNWTVYDETVELTKADIAFPTDMKIRFVCQAADIIDDVMIDEITIAAR